MPIQVTDIVAPQSVTKYLSKAKSKSDDNLTDTVSSKTDLILNSGCSEHMFNLARRLTDFNRYNVYEKYVVVINVSRVPVIV